MAGQARIRIRFGKRVGEWFDYLLVSQKELVEILDGTGWEAKQFIKSKTPHYITIIKKRDSVQAR